MHPLNEYGRQKAELQQKLPEICGDEYLLIRPSKIFGIIPGDRTLIDEMVQQLERLEPIRAAYDQIFCPILVSDVVKAVVHLQVKNCRGIYHICGEAMSRLDIAREVAKQMASPLSLIQRIALNDLKETFQRPKNTSMSCNKFHKAIEMRFRSVIECIRDSLSGKHV